MPPVQRKPVIPPLTVEQCRAVDRYAIEQLKIPGAVLMENAGRNAADHIEAWLRRRPQRPAGGHTDAMAHICIICGKGNNGGDGFVIARHLFNRGYAVSVDLAADAAALAGDAAIHHQIARRMGIDIRELHSDADPASAAARWRESAILVDALLGTGFSGAVREPLASIIERINATREAAGPRPGPAPLIVAVDVPSGLDANAGTADGPVVLADRTITFLAPKTGYATRTARACLGRVTVADIGAPLSLILEKLNLQAG